ncbi:putative glycosyltransferase 2 [Ananas comosus]|uniref:Putative glycosyltransferase 2 n=1 Tax=Ananas comosus TaxID=4615 RepID=A0A199UGY3_ANACO|nr:putative glycosyltransferase 2 [Ananas comosus]
MAGSRSSRGGSSSASSSRIRRIKKTFNNLKITVLCGFVTVLVLRGTIGVNLGNPPQSDDDAAAAAHDARVVEDIDRILREIRSDEDDDDEGRFPPPLTNSTSTSASASLANSTSGAIASNYDPRPEDLRLGRPAPALAPPEPWLPLPDPRREPSDPPRHRIPAQPLRQPPRRSLPPQGD